MLFQVKNVPLHKREQLYNEDGSRGIMYEFDGLHSKYVGKIGDFSVSDAYANLWHGFGTYWPQNWLQNPGPLLIDDIEYT